LAKTINERADVVALLAEIFRDLGYEGTSLSEITKRTGFGKGSLYNFFPGGKQEMAVAVLAEIDAWFETHVYEPLRREEPEHAITSMWDAADRYFRSGGRICLVGAFALDGTRDLFSNTISSYFRRWIEALRDALVRHGVDLNTAAIRSEQAVLGIQGALVLARALDDGNIFSRSIARMSRDLLAPETSRSSDLAPPKRSKTAMSK
jgi:AcrR family transcriptional regulator